MRTFKGVLRVSPLLLLVCLFPGCTTTEPSAVTGERSSYAYSWEKEQQIGRETDAEIVKEYGLYEEPRVQEYVERVGLGVLQSSDLRDKDAPDIYRGSQFTFRVLDSPIVNAFALPGGYVYVTRGLLTHAQNEAQLATVLAHEVAHVAARHSSRQAVKAQYGQLGMIAGAILGQSILKDPTVAQGVLQAGGQAFQLFMTKYSREDEREADRLGMEYAARRGYDVSQAAAFFNTLDRIQQREGVNIPSWQATHPDPGERETTAQQVARKYHRDMAMQMVGETELLNHIEGVVIGENPREGFVHNQTFYHPDLRFKFPVPSGWKVRNEKSAVLMAEPSRRALLSFQGVPGTSAREAASQFTQSTKGLQVDRAQEVRINGMNAVAVTGQGQTQQGTAGLLAFFVEKEGKVFGFMGLSGADAFNSFAPTFERVAQGFDHVDDRSVLEVQPARVQIVRAERSAPFTSFLPTSTVPGLTPEDLAIINHVQPNETIPAGAYLKVPRLGQGRR
jgi:predicted Zn-dependent protease